MNKLYEKLLSKLEKMTPEELEEWTRVYRQWSNDRFFKENPELFELNQLHMEPGELSIKAFSPMVAVIAEEAAKMLEANNAKNYLEMEFIPRVARNLRSIRMTVRWSNGRMPGQEVARLKEEFGRLDSLIERIGDKRPSQADMKAITETVKRALSGHVWREEDDE